MPEPSNIRVRIVGATDVGLVREHNEDSYLIIDLDTGESDYSHLREYDLGKRGALLVVCDGMGGAAAGEVASQMAVQSMRQQLLPEPLAGSPATAGEGGAAKASEPASRSEAGSADKSADKAGDKPADTAGDKPADKPADKAGDKPAEKIDEQQLHQVARSLREAATRANQEIYEAACADIAKAGMGTTLTALMLLQSSVVVAQVGDSRAYLWRQGKLTQITHDQSLVNQLLDSGQITPEQAKLFEHSNVILQALGVQEDIEVVLSTETLRRDDRLLLCSDGLVGVVSDEEIQEVLSTTENLEDGVHRLIDMARAGGGPDNITVILAQGFGDGLPAPGADDLAQYRVMALDGDKPQERRAWSTDYSYAGGPSSGRELGPSSASSGRLVSPVSLLSLAAVLALAVTGLVVGLVLYPQRPPALVSCRVASDQPGLQLMVDDKPAATSQVPSVEIKLAPGEHRLWLSSPQDGTRRSEELVQPVGLGQRCEVELHTLAASGTTPPVTTGDHIGADAGAGHSTVGAPVAGAQADGGVADAGSPAYNVVAPDDDDETGPTTGGSNEGTETGTPGHKTKHHRRRKTGEQGTAGQTGGPATTTPAAVPDLASPAADKPAADKPAADKPAADKPAADKPAADKPAADKPAADKPATDKPAADKPAADKPAADKPAVDKPAADKPAADKPAPQPAADKPAPSP